METSIMTDKEPVIIHSRRRVYFKTIGGKRIKDRHRQTDNSPMGIYLTYISGGHWIFMDRERMITILEGIVDYLKDYSQVRVKNIIHDLRIWTEEDLMKRRMDVIETRKKTNGYGK